MLEMDDHLQTISINEQRTMAKPMEGLEEVLLDDSRPKLMTKIDTFANPPIYQALTTFLSKIHTRGVLPQLTGTCSNSQESQRKVENVCGLHGLK